LRRLGIETGNLYSGFLAAALALLAPGGELVAITPRSFCNGPYFRPFREALLRSAQLRRLHIFESREQAFSDDEVLQENIILYAVKTGRPGTLDVSLQVQTGATTEIWVGVGVVPVLDGNLRLP